MDDDRYILLEDQKIYPGDFLKYYDENNVRIGFGAYVSKYTDELRPLTRSYYTLINIKTKQKWKVYCHRYKFYILSHLDTNSSSDMARLFKLSAELSNIKTNYLAQKND